MLPLTLAGSLSIVEFAAKNLREPKLMGIARVIQGLCGTIFLTLVTPAPYAFFIFCASIIPNGLFVLQILESDNDPSIRDGAFVMSILVKIVNTGIIIASFSGAPFPFVPLGLLATAHLLTFV